MLHTEKTSEKTYSNIQTTWLEDDDRKALYFDRETIPFRFHAIQNKYKKCNHSALISVKGAE